MNAIPPRDQLAAKPQREPVRLTMDFDEEPQRPDAEAAAADPQLDADAITGAGGRDPHRRDTVGAGGTRPRGGGPPLPPQLAGIELVLTVEVGSLRLPLKELLAVEPGQLLGLDSMAAEPVSVLVNGKPFARGEIVAIGERFGVRLIDIVAPVAGDG